MSEQTTPTLTPEQIAKNQETLDRIAREYEQKDAQKKHDDMIADLCATNPAFKNLHDKYRNEIFTLNPNLKSITDKNQMLATFVPAAELLSEKDKKIVTPPTPEQKPAATTTPLDQPIPQGNGTFKNQAGEVTDEKGVKLLSENVRLQDARNLEVPLDSSVDNATKARVIATREAQKNIVRFERPTW
jgi:hypothetical protein